MKPPIKWPGGKTSLVRIIRSYMPQDFGRYHEPFMGGGALFFDGAAGIRTAHLSDANPDLVNFYRVLRNRPEQLLAVLPHYKVTEDEYYRVRSHVPETSLEQAARFLYLNKTCFNGVYRVNSKGEFNTPWGKKPEGYVWYKRTDLEFAAALLHESTVRLHDYKTALESAVAGDFVYLDPPYDGTFDQYTTERFDQAQLKTEFDKLTERGVYALLSNANTPAMREQYATYWQEKITVRQAVKPGTKREELLIANYIPCVG